MFGDLVINIANFLTNCAMDEMKKDQWRESPRPVLLTKKVTATRMKIECKPNPGAVLRHLKPVLLRTDWIIETLRFHRSKTKKALRNADGQHTRLI